MNRNIVEPAITEAPANDRASDVASDMARDVAHDLANSVAASTPADGRGRAFLRCVGGFTLVLGGREVEIRSRKHRAMLAFLAVEGAASRDMLTELLWSTRFREQARQSLRQALFTLRRELGESVLRVDGEMVELVIDDGPGDAPVCDVLALVALADMPAETRQETWPAVAERFSLDAALALGEASVLPGHGVPDLPFRDWVARTEARIRGLGRPDPDGGPPHGTREARATTERSPAQPPRSDGRRTTSLDHPTFLSWTLPDEDALFERHGFERAQAIVAEIEATAEDIIERHAGSLLAARARTASFGYRAGFETACEAALSAATELSEVVRKAARTTALRVGIGVATGPGAMLSDMDGDTRIVGPPVALSQRLAARASSAADGEEPAIAYADGRSRAVARNLFAFVGVTKGGDARGADHIARLRGPTSRGRFVALRRPSGPMLGRDDERALIAARWARARAGEGQCIVISGPAGIGKSRLAATARHLAASAATTRVTLQCALFGASRPFQPISEHFALLPAGQRARLPADVVAFDALLHVRGPEPVDPDAYRARAFETLYRALRALARSGPIYICIEDIHWADELTLAALQTLVPRLADLPILLVLTRRSGQPSLPSVLDEEAHVLHLNLAKLPDRDIAALVSHGLRADPNSETVKAVVSRAGGNPFFAEEILAARRDGGRRGSQAEPPQSLRGLLDDRLRRLEAGPLKLLRFLSVVGLDFDRAALRIAAGAEDIDVDAALARLIEDSLVIVHVSDENRLTVRHALLLEAAYASLMPQDRVRLHGLVADSADALPRMTNGARAGHLYLAQRWEDAARCALTAAEANVSRSAIKTSRGLLALARRALSHLARQAKVRRREGPAPETIANLALRAFALAGTTEIARSGSGSQRAETLYGRAVAEAERYGAACDPRLAFPLYWGWWFTASDFRDMVARSRVLQDRFAGIGDEEVRLQAIHCAWASAINTGGVAASIALVDEGLALYDPDKAGESCARFGNHDTRVCGLGVRAQAHWLMGRAEEARRDAEAAMKAAREGGHIGTILHALDMALLVHTWSERREAVVALAEEMRGIAREHDHPGAEAKAMIFLGWARAADDPEAGLADFEAGLARQRALETEEDVPHYEDMRADMLIEAGRADEAVPILEKAIAHAMAVGNLCWLAALQRRLGLALVQAGAEPGRAIETLEMACLCAEEQGATGLERQAARDLKRLAGMATVPAS